MRLWLAVVSVLCLTAPSWAGGLPVLPVPNLSVTPLPVGSGARALGRGGAFVAVADDATAASWNPAGLVQLERPEASFVYRFSRETDEHRSRSDDYAVGRDEFSNDALNYLSVAVPFRCLERNWVFSANYQEAYDFTQRFEADITSQSTRSQSEVQSATFSETLVERFDEDTLRVDVTSHLTTYKVSVLDQVLTSGTLTGLDFQQQGVIDAVTPALAVGITPKLSFGAALNLYQDDLFGGQAIRSRTRALYSGDSRSLVSVRDTLTTVGSYTYDGVAIFPGGGGLPPLEVPISDAGDYPAFSDTETPEDRQNIRYDGVYDELNTFRDLEGINATVGLLWVASRHLSLGLGLDLPWTADAHQTKTVRNTITTLDASGSRVLDVTSTEQIESRDVEFEFPLYWALGAVWRWNNRFYTTLDVSQTLWSDFSFQAEGDAKINPLDGSPLGANRLDDCWAVRCGAEYLCVLKHTEIPVRGGLSWEQRPAVGSPDEYWGVSAGTGISLGKDPGKVILDVAYTYSWGEDVLGTLVPDQQGVATDVTRHEGFVSCIWHF